MDKKENPQPKNDANAGGAGFNRGSAQDPEFDKGVPVSDEEKKTGHSQPRGAEKNEKSPNGRGVTEDEGDA